MEMFELILVILACVIVSAVLARFIPKVAPPLVQIAVGLLAAVVLPGVTGTHVDSELFLVLFIAPMLFNESRKANKRELWRNKWSILSLAIGLVLATVLVVGFSLNLIVPSIPLAAAFALAGALAPTDAAAVMAMGSSVKLSTQQEARLSGESLINDASGVVAFQFAIAAAVTGSFSAIDVAETFGVLFLGGLVFGAVVGLTARFAVRWMRQHGLADTRLHVVYEVFTPFAVFLAGEFLGVSGILAVVACGFAMSDPPSRLVSAAEARNIVLSNSVWRVIVFLINGVIFVMLGMQLPFAFTPALRGDFSATEVLGLVALIFALIMVVRFLWVLAMDIRPKRNEPHAPLRRKLRSALITTIAGPKGSVTLSIIFTIPMVLANGQPFPERDLLIFLTAGVILCTLVLANVALPLLGSADAPEPHDENEKRVAIIKVLEGTIDELVSTIRQMKDRQLIPAMRLTIAAYRTRLARERFREDNCGNALAELEGAVLGAQQKRADELLAADGRQGSRERSTYFFHMLRTIRASLGYYGEALYVGSRARTLGEKAAMALQRFRNWLTANPVDSQEHAKVYYDACHFEIALEQTSLRCLDAAAESEEAPRAKAAGALRAEHEAALESLWGRLCYFERGEGADDGASSVEGQPAQKAQANIATCDVPDEAEFLQWETQSFNEQFAMASHYANMVDAWALTMELEQIQRLFIENEIDEETAKSLRTDVYNMQMALE